MLTTTYMKLTKAMEKKKQRQQRRDRKRGTHNNPAYMQNVKRYLDRHNISVAGLSRTSGISYAHLLRIISGHYKPTLQTCNKIAKGLDITLPELIAMINMPVNTKPE